MAAKGLFFDSAAVALVAAGHSPARAAMRLGAAERDVADAVERAKAIPTGLELPAGERVAEFIRQMAASAAECDAAARHWQKRHPVESLAARQLAREIRLDIAALQEGVPLPTLLRRRPGVGGHHGLLDSSRRLRLPRSAIPARTEEFARELGLIWWLDRTYGERSSPAREGSAA